MKWLNDMYEEMILNSMSYARGDFYVKMARTGLRDNQIIIPLTAGIDSRRITAESWWLSYALVNHSCHNGTHSNWCTAQNTPSFHLWRAPAGDLVCLKRQKSRDFLWKNSVQDWLRFLFNRRQKLLSPLWSEKCSLMNQLKSISVEDMSAMTPLDHHCFHWAVSLETLFT